MDIKLKRKKIVVPEYLSTDPHFIAKISILYDLIIIVEFDDPLSINRRVIGVAIGAGKLISNTNNKLHQVWTYCKTRSYNIFVHHLIKHRKLFATIGKEKFIDELERILEPVERKGWILN